MAGSPGRDDADGFSAVGEDDCDKAAGETPNGQAAGFPVGLPGFDLEMRRREDLQHIVEVDAVLGDVGQALRFVPFELKGHVAMYVDTMRGSRAFGFRLCGGGHRIGPPVRNGNDPGGVDRSRAYRR